MKNLGLKKIMALILRVIAYIILGIGIIITLPWVLFAFYAIFTHIHMMCFEMSDDLRMFYIEWMTIGVVPMAVGGGLLIWAENILQAIRWKLSRK